jgi:sulfur carrier protein
MIEIRLNDERRQIDDGSTLAALVESLGQTPAALATAVNGDFVPRTQRQDRRLCQGDVVTTFQPITGG